MSAIILVVLRLALAFALYAFLGWALFMLWQDIRQHSRGYISSQSESITLVPQIPEVASLHQFRQTEISLGSLPSCDCSLDDPSVSSLHARIYQENSQWWIEDLDSSSGTFINDERVVSPALLTNGDRLRCGQVVLLVKTTPNPTTDQLEAIT